MKRSKKFLVALKVDALVNIEISAPTLEDGLANVKAELGKLNLFAEDVEVVDSTEEITGIF